MIYWIVMQFINVNTQVVEYTVMAPSPTKYETFEQCKEAEDTTLIGETILNNNGESLVVRFTCGESIELKAEESVEYEEKF